VLPNIISEQMGGRGGSLDKPTTATVTSIGNGLVAWTDADTKSTTIDADNKTITVVRAVRFEKDGPQYKFTRTYNFKNATFAEIAELAVSTLVIDDQRDIREKKKMPSHVECDVHEHVNRVRASATHDPVATNIRSFEKMTPAQRAEHVKLLAEMVAADAAKSETAKS
jgi:hypothetical protein